MFNRFVNMKILLTLIMCSYTASTCLPPYEWPEEFPDMYECMLAGYEQGTEKMLEIGRYEVNKHQIYIKFTCTPLKTT